MKSEIKYQSAGRWFQIILVLLLCAMPQFVRYQRSGPARIMENLSIMSSQETWIRMHEGEANAWMIPSWNGRPRVNKPPMLVWLNLLVWADLSPSTGSADQLIARSRLLAGCMALIGLLGVYGCGRCMSTHRTALLAMFVTGSSFMLTKQARFASYDIHLLAWVMLAMFWGLRAILSHRARWFDWVLCGIFWGGAMLTKGAVAYVLVGIPLLAILVFIDRKALRRYAGWGGAACLATMLLGIWYAYVFIHDHTAWTWVLREYEYAVTGPDKPFWYYAGIIGLVFPWSFAFVAAWIMPWVKANRPAHRVQWFPWVWFATLFVCLSLSSSKTQRYILPVLPVAGLLVALFIDESERKKGELSGVRFLKGLAVVHWIVLGCVCFILPVLLLLQNHQDVVRHLHQYGVPELPDMHYGAALSLLLLCVPALWAGVAWIRKGKIAASAYAAGWIMLIASTYGYYGYAVSEDNGFYPYRADAEKVATVTASAPFYYLSFVPDSERIDPFVLAPVERDPDKEFLIYFRGIIPSATVDDTCEMMNAQQVFYMCARDEHGRGSHLDNLGLTFLMRFEDGGGPSWKLYRYEPAIGIGDGRRESDAE